MRAWIIILMLAVAVALAKGATKTPINNGILQSDLNANHYKITLANLADYAGANLTWNVATNKFDAAGGTGLPTGGTTGQALTKNSNTNFDVGWSTITGGGGTSTDGPAPWNIRSPGDSANPGTYPFTAANSGLWIYDRTGREIFRLWATGSDMTGTMHNNLNTYIGYQAGFTQPSDNTTAGNDNVGVGARALCVNTTGATNVAVGSNAGQFNTTGFANVAVGAYALSDNNVGEGVTGVGANALKASKGGGNTGVGFGSLFILTSGAENTAIGRYSGSTSISDNGCVFLGEFAQRSGDSGVALSNAIAIGYLATVAASNRAVIGSSSTTDAYFGSETGNAILHGKGAYPGGGTTGQVLTKNSSTDYDASWAAAGGGNVSNSGTPTVGQKALWVDATHIQGVTDNALQWDGGATNLVAGTGRTSLGGTTVGQSFFTLTNPSAITFPEISATNVVSAKTAAQLKTDLSLTIGTNVEAWDTDLDTWAAITRASGFDAFVATPSSANLRTLMTDESGTGALLFSGATSPDFTTGITVGAAAASGKVLMGNGTVYTTSTATFPTGAPGAGKLLAGNGSNYVLTTPTYPNAAGAVGYTIRSDATNFASYPAQLVNSSTTSQATFSTSDIYVAGSNITVTAGDFKAGGQYKCVFDMTKSAGTGAIVITLRVGTLGTTGDAAIQTFTFGAGTGVADLGIFEVIASWRSVGSGTSAVIQGMCRCTHQLSTTGLISNAGGWMVLGSPSPSSGFASNTATNIGISFNGSTAFAGTATMVQAQLQQ